MKSISFALMSLIMISEPAFSQSKTTEDRVSDLEQSTSRMSQTLAALQNEVNAHEVNLRYGKAPFNLITGFSLSCAANGLAQCANQFCQSANFAHGGRPLAWSPAPAPNTAMLSAVVCAP